MTKEAVAIIGLGLTLIASAVGYGMQIGALTERVEAQRKTIDSLSSDIKALTTDLHGTRLEILRILAEQPRSTR